ncbi:hypothetical protein Tco_0018578 [Tanacetum coccineum]
MSALGMAGDRRGGPQWECRVVVRSGWGRGGGGVVRLWEALLVWGAGGSGGTGVDVFRIFHTGRGGDGAEEQGARRLWQGKTWFWVAVGRTIGREVRLLLEPSASRGFLRLVPIVTLPNRVVTEYWSESVTS